MSESHGQPREHDDRHNGGADPSATPPRERLAGGLTLAALVIAFVMANSPLYETYWFVHHTPVSIRIGEYGIEKPLIIWINKGLMVFFFLLVGLEIKREVLQGQLAGVRRIALPLLAAAGGMAAPALVYLLFNGAVPETHHGWAIPTATDIVLAMAVLSLLGGRVPQGVAIFLATLAIFDDIGAMLVIALFYSEGLSMSALWLATLGIAALYALNRYQVSQTAPYALVGVFLWATVLQSGVHATLVGALVALAMPLRAHRHGEPCSPLCDLESRLRPWVILGVVPIFAFFNAGISLSGLESGTLWTPVAMGIALGLFVGKQFGVFGAIWLGVRAGIGELPSGVKWGHVYGIALLAGIGFTMSLFITSLAFDDRVLGATARYAILVGSILSAVFGLLILHRTSRANA